MRRLALSLAAVLAIVSPALSQEDRAPKPPQPHCMALTKIKAANPMMHWTTLTPGQFHFAAGIYVGNPATPEGMPPGDSALLGMHDGSKDGIVVWVRGPLGCAPLEFPEKMLKLVNAIKTGALSDDGSEL